MLHCDKHLHFSFRICAYMYAMLFNFNNTLMQKITKELMKHYLEIQLIIKKLSYP